MNWKRAIGLDILSEKYSYVSDSDLGYTAAEKAADSWVPTTCGYCSVGCGMYIGVKEGRAVSVRANPDHPVNRGKLCPKGLAEHYTIAAPGRLTTPLLGGKPVSWDAALDTMVERVRRVQKQHGPDAFGVISTGQLVTEEFYTLGKLAQLGFGTKNYDGNTTLCMASAVSGYKRSFGCDGPPGAYEDLEKADLILLIGANIADNHPILCQRLEKNAGATVIVADPRVTKTAMMADVYLPLKPRSDIALINGIMHILIRAGLINHDYIEQHTTGFAELACFLEKYTPGNVAGITGLSEDLLNKTAMLYGRAKAAFIGWTMGVNHSTQGAETVNAICDMALITGNIGRAGAAPFSITGQCNAMGTREAGFTSSLPGYRKFESAEDRAELARLWNVDIGRIPTSRGLAYPDIIEAAVGKKIRALWIIATNPAVSFPNIEVLRQAFENLDFLVVQDGFPTPTSEFADLVLPAAIWGEKEGTYTNSERRVSKVNRAVAPTGEAKPDFDIFLAIAGKLGHQEALFPGWTGPRDAFEEWRRVSSGRPCDYSGMSWELIEELGGIQWPFPRAGQGVGRTPSSAPDPLVRLFPRPSRPTKGSAADQGATESLHSAARLYTDGRFHTDDGKARLFCVECEPFPEQPTADFPFVLNTGRTVEHWHTRTKTGRVPILERMSPRAWLEMNPRDARKLALRPHDRVDIISRRSRVRGVELRVTEIVAPGQVFMPFHYVETNSNLVTQSAYDPISREPNYKQCSVRVERAGVA